MKTKRRFIIATLVYIMLYAALNLLFLTNFPFIHSDESWLGGLSRNMLQNDSLSVTEPFFTAKSRYPHALKSLFHLFQQGAIALFGYSAFSLRLLGLLFSCSSLLVFFHAAKRILKSSASALAAMVFLSADIQFVYASHFARSEIMLLFLLCVCLYCLSSEELSIKHILLCSAATGLGVFIHPNAFLLACGCGAFLLLLTLTRELPVNKLLLYCAVTGAFAAVTVGISYAMDGQFLTHYFQNGDAEFDIISPPGQKLSDLFGFFGRLWRGESGTYYLPDIKPQFFIFSLCAVLCGCFAAAMRREEPKLSRSCAGLLCLEGGIIAGTALIGRLNQTSIIFLLPGAVLLFCIAMKILCGRRTLLLISVSACLLAVFSAGQILTVLRQDSYDSYLNQLSLCVPADAKALANLNTGFYFENDALLDYRNLPYAAENGDIDSFIEESGIQYILYSDELDFIYENRPYYNVIYGNPMFVPQLRDFCEARCLLVSEFYSPAYGKRINAIAADKEYGHVRVYKVM